jgi:hypothetical protein
VEKMNDNVLSVYIGTHPDDIDIGMSGSLYKYSYNKHPILWIVVTDGGADYFELSYESKENRNWVDSDDEPNIDWVAPDGNTIQREHYSRDLVQKRCGIEFQDNEWMRHRWTHPTVFFGEACDWISRVKTFVGEDVETMQLYYLDPIKQLLYPDGALSKGDSFTNSIAVAIFKNIVNYIEAKNYSKDIIRIYSHAPQEVAENSDENLDHRIVGNAVREAIKMLLKNHIKMIHTTWFTIYFKPRK